MLFRSVPETEIVHLVRQISTVTWMVGRDGYVVDVPEWCKLTGQRPEDAAGEGWMDAVHPDDRDRARAAWMTSLDHGSVYNTDYRVRCADGIYRWFNARGVPILAPEGSIVRWVGVVLLIAGQHRLLPPGPLESVRERPQHIRPYALRAARALLGWTVIDLADACGLSPTTIRRFETDQGQMQARPSNLARLIETFALHGVHLVVSEGTAVGAFLEGPKAANVP